jgi:hypothetical protein
VTGSDGLEGADVPGSGFHAIRGGGAAARFAAAEAALLRSLAGQVAELVGGEVPQSGDKTATPDKTATEDKPAAADKTATADKAATADETAARDERMLEEMFALSDSSALPDDPVLARLLPDAYPDDPDAAGEFRRYTESGLRSGKVAAARTVLGTLPEDGGRVRLSADEAQAWLRSLNDIRLALGVRLNVTEDRDDMLEQAAQGGPQAAGLWIYDWLTLLQETLVEALW